MKIDEINYKDYEVDTPYPEIGGEDYKNKDPRTTAKIIDTYAGGKGELTACTQYIYQAFIVEPQDKVFHTLLKRIAIKEMHHLEILSQVLIQLGVNPKFCKYIDNNINICNNWSANNVRYITNVKEFLEYNIHLEEDAIRSYNNIIDTTENLNIREVIARIVEDEESHLALFNKMLECVS